MTALPDVLLQEILQYLGLQEFYQAAAPEFFECKTQPCDQLVKAAFIEETIDSRHINNMLWLFEHCYATPNNLLRAAAAAGDHNVMVQAQTMSARDYIGAAKSAAKHGQAEMLRTVGVWGGLRPQDIEKTTKWPGGAEWLDDMSAVARLAAWHGQFTVIKLLDEWGVFDSKHLPCLSRAPVIRWAFAAATEAGHTEIEEYMRKIESEYVPPTIYSFGFRPESFQPSGTWNVSHLPEQTIRFTSSATGMALAEPLLTIQSEETAVFLPNGTDEVPAHTLATPSRIFRTQLRDLLEKKSE